MLNFIRERAQGWIAWFIVGLITIPFALWGVNSYLNGPSDVVVAKVNGEKIKLVELQRAEQRYREQMRNALGNQFDPSMFEGPAVKRRVLQGLIQQKLIHDANKDLGQHVSDADIAKFIESTKAFQKNGKFDPDYYAMVLSRVGFTPAKYEAQLRSDLLSQELTDNVQQTAFVTKHQLDQVLSLEKETRDIAYGVIPENDYMDKVSVTDDAMKQFYQSHQDSFTAPEEVSVNYLRLSVKDLAKQVKVTDEELKKYYANNQDKFVTPEERRASHILIEGDSQKSLDKIKEIQAKLAKGEDFAKLAKEYSEDAGSANNGGDLGYFQQGVMDPAFEKAVFGMNKIGEVSQPVKTHYGYHLIKLTGIRKSEAKSFDQAKAEVERLYRQKKAEQVFYDKADKLANLSYENPESLDVTAEALGLKIQTTQPFTRNGGDDIVTSNKKVIQAAFGDDVLNNDLNSTVIELSKTDLVVIHKKTHKPASVKPFDSVKADIRRELLADKASAMAKDAGEAITKKLQSGASADSLFDANNWHLAKTYERNSKDQAMNPEILQHAFAAPAPKGKPVYTGFKAADGDFIVVELTAVHPGDISKVSQEERDGLKSQLLRIDGNAQLAAFLDNLRANADIEIYTKNLK